MVVVYGHHPVLAHVGEVNNRIMINVWSWYQVGLCGVGGMWEGMHAGPIYNHFFFFPSRTLSPPSLQHTSSE